MSIDGITVTVLVIVFILTALCAIDLLTRDPR